MAFLVCLFSCAMPAAWKACVALRACVYASDANHVFGLEKKNYVQTSGEAMVSAHGEEDGHQSARQFTALACV